MPKVKPVPFGEDVERAIQAAMTLCDAYAKGERCDWHELERATTELERVCEGMGRVTQHEVYVHHMAGELRRLVRFALGTHVDDVSYPKLEHLKEWARILADLFDKQRQARGVA